MQSSTLQKQQIVADLTALTGGGLVGGVGLQSVVPMDGVKDLVSMTWPNGLPGIVIPTPVAKTASKVDSQHNDRVNVFTMFLVFSASELATPYDVEIMTDAILNAFDQDQTLGGTSFPTCECSTSEAETVLDAAGKEFIIVQVVLKAHTLIDVYAGMDYEAGVETTG